MTIRIEADLLIPGRGEPIEDATVVADRATIVYAGPRSGAPASDGATVEVPVAMPGLWECHAHFDGVDRPDLMEQVVQPEARRVARATIDLQRTLMGGVTSAREVGGFGLDIAPAIDAGQVPGPTHSTAQGGSCRRPAATPTSTPSRSTSCIQIPHLGILCDGVPEVLRAVRTNLRKNARVIKICASGGVMSRGRPSGPSAVLGRGIAGHRGGGRTGGALCGGPLPRQAGGSWRLSPCRCADDRARLVHGRGGHRPDGRAGSDLRADPGSSWTSCSTRRSSSPAMPTKGCDGRRCADGGHEAGDRQGVKIAMGTDIFVSGDMYGRNGYEIKLLQGRRNERPSRRSKQLRRTGRTPLDRKLRRRVN